MVDSKTLVRIISEICSNYYENSADVADREDVGYMLGLANGAIDAISTVANTYAAGDHSMDKCCEGCV